MLPSSERGWDHFTHTHTHTHVIPLYTLAVLKRLQAVCVSVGVCPYRLVFCFVCASVSPSSSILHVAHPLLHEWNVCMCVCVVFCKRERERERRATVTAMAILFRSQFFLQLLLLLHALVSSKTCDWESCFYLQQLHLHFAPFEIMRPGLRLAKDR